MRTGRRKAVTPKGIARNRTFRSDETIVIDDYAVLENCSADGGVRVVYRGGAFPEPFQLRVHGHASVTFDGAAGRAVSLLRCLRERDADAVAKMLEMAPKLEGVLMN